MPSAVVVGAGLSGLTAARDLEAEGWDVRVLEAKDRVGGRTWSRELPGGAVAELGAEFILPGNSAVRSLASDLDLALWDKGVRYGTREPRGGFGTDAAALEAAVAVLDRELADLPEGSELSASDLLRSIDIDPGAREVLLVRTAISSASPPETVAARNLAGLAHVDDEPSPGIAGGNQNLSLEMARRLEGNVRLADPVISVDWSGDAVTVRTEAGHRFEADRCVISVPARVIGRIDFTPELPERKASALSEVEYGHAAKLLVPLAEAAPISAVLSVPEGYWCWTETGENDAPVPLVSCFAGSAGALGSLEVDTGPEAWLRSLARLRPDLRLKEEDAILSTWSDDPWAGAAYSVSPSADLCRRLAEPVGPLAFAGEHTAGEFSGLMEGAIRSGRAAARNLTAPERN